MFLLRSFFFLVCFCFLDLFSNFWTLCFPIECSITYFFPHTSSKKISTQDAEIHLLVSSFFSHSLFACLKLFSQQCSLFARLLSLTYWILNVPQSLNLGPIKQSSPLIIVTGMDLKQVQFPEKIWSFTVWEMGTQRINQKERLQSHYHLSSERLKFTVFPQIISLAMKCLPKDSKCLLNWS